MAQEMGLPMEQSENEVCGFPEQCSCWLVFVKGEQQEILFFGEDWKQWMKNNWDTMGGPWTENWPTRALKNFCDGIVNICCG